MELTLSLIKADVGSIGGHTTPTANMIHKAQKEIKKAIEKKTIIDGFVSHTGDDIALLMSHRHDINNPIVHQLAWDIFVQVTKLAQQAGCYGAGQDLLVNAPSGNIRGAGPGVAELSFTVAKSYRPSESFMFFAADKCSPGAFNLPLFLAFADPMYCTGLMLPQMIQGFTFDIIDMSKTDGDHIITLHAPEDNYKIAFLLRDNERFGIKNIYSRTYDEPVAAISTDRLHNIAGKYTGKDDPVALIRNQGIFPAPEEIISPFAKAHYVGGDSRGSHTMPLMPVAINTPVTGLYCLPIIACLGFSINNEGYFSESYVDFFDNPAWDLVRLRAQEKAIEMRAQGWSGAAMLPYSELEYGGFKETLSKLEKQFSVKQRTE